MADIIDVFKVIGLIIFCVIVYNKLRDNYINGKKNPFWTGTETIQVCKVPYYSSQGCYKLPVTISEKKYATIQFNNGGYVSTYVDECYFAANLDSTPRYVFCRSEDRDGQQWDFMPAWVNY